MADLPRGESPGTGEQAAPGDPVRAARQRELARRIQQLAPAVHALRGGQAPVRQDTLEEYRRAAAEYDRCVPELYDTVKELIGWWMDRHYNHVGSWRGRPDQEDLRAGWGYPALLRALQDYDPDRGAFATWLLRKLDQELTLQCSDDARPSVPAHERAVVSGLRTVAKQLRADLAEGPHGGPGPTTEQVRQQTLAQRVAEVRAAIQLSDGVDEQEAQERALRRLSRDGLLARLDDPAVLRYALTGPEQVSLSEPGGEDYLPAGDGPAESAAAGGDGGDGPSARRQLATTLALATAGTDPATRRAVTAMLCGRVLDPRHRAGGGATPSGHGPGRVAEDPLAGGDAHRAGDRFGDLEDAPAAASVDPAGASNRGSQGVDGTGEGACEAGLASGARLVPPRPGQVGKMFGLTPQRVTKVLEESRNRMAAPHTQFCLLHLDPAQIVTGADEDSSTILARGRRRARAARRVVVPA